MRVGWISPDKSALVAFAMWVGVAGVLLSATCAPSASAAPQAEEFRCTYRVVHPETPAQRFTQEERALVRRAWSALEPRYYAEYGVRELLENFSVSVNSGVDKNAYVTFGIVYVAADVSEKLIIAPVARAYVVGLNGEGTTIWKDESWEPSCENFTKVE